MDIEKLKYLFNNMDNDIGLLIDNVLTDSKTIPKYSAVKTSNIIKCYIQIMKELGEELPYRSIKEFFIFNAYSEDEYSSFEKQLTIESNYHKKVHCHARNKIRKKAIEAQTHTNIKLDIESLRYLLYFTDHNIKLLVDNIITDSITDPHYSAVTATNYIKLYIQITNELGEKAPYSSVEEFFYFNNYTNKDYRIFEEHRKKEAEYYQGVQY